MTDNDWRKYVRLSEVCIWRERREMRWGLVLNEIKTKHKPEAIAYWDSRESIEDDGAELINMDNAEDG